MSKRFRVAFSFAGEKRAFVADVAAILAAQYGQDRVLYDKYHEPEFARPDLAFHLSNLYFEEADLVVAVLCDQYAHKQWCGLEWNAIYGLINSGKVDLVMLARFDRVDGRGLYGNAGFLDLDDLTPQQAADSIVQRLAVNEGVKATSPKDGPKGPDWPEVAPALDWPVADHRAARSAFGELVTRSSPFRLLPIHGGSETGKTHLAKQFQGNAFRIPDLACGLFDFKGTSDMDAELRNLAEQLDVPPTRPNTGVVAQLTEIIASLKDKPRPTLLIFDTFERAGEAERWVTGSLLLTMSRSSWLRVVVIGQKTTRAFGEPWAAFSAQPVALAPPTPEDWFDYGRQHREKLTFDNVVLMHEYSNGKSALLAQLLGPMN